MPKKGGGGKGKGKGKPKINPNETEEERRIRLEVEALLADEKEVRQQVSGSHGARMQWQTHV